MKKIINILLFLFVGTALLAQDDEPKDSIKTEVVNVVTSFAPKITDAFKIKIKPVIELYEGVTKKELNYEIISAPVASTFTPKSVAFKPIKLGDRERLFDNYFSVGFGNRFKPYLEAYVHKNIDFDSEYRISVKFNLSADPVNDTEISSSYFL